MLVQLIILDEKNPEDRRIFLIQLFLLYNNCRNVYVEIYVFQ